jgi:hypothetical protein
MTVLERRPVTDEPVGGKAMTIKWRLSHNFLVFLEIDTEAVEPFLPRCLTPVEVRPGISLLCLGCLDYWPGHFRPDSPRFSESFCVVSVQPDLSIPMPNPRFSFYALSVYSDSPDFCRIENEHIYTPNYLVESFRIEWSPDGRSVAARDDQGPIMTLRNTNPRVKFRPQVLYGQHFNDASGGAIVDGRWNKGSLHKGPWEWDGPVFEHQTQGDWGRVYPHHFFGGVDLSRIRGCYRQMIAEPGAISFERFYQMEPMGGARS